MLDLRLRLEANQYLEAQLAEARKCNYALEISLTPLSFLAISEY
jgi:hypothetical protein